MSGHNLPDSTVEYLRSLCEKDSPRIQELKAEIAALRKRVEEVERYMNAVCEAMDEPSWDNAYDAARVGMLAKKRIADATSPEGVGRAFNTMNYHIGYHGEIETGGLELKQKLIAAIKAALGEVV